MLLANKKFEEVKGIFAQIRHLEKRLKEEHGSTTLDTAQERPGLIPASKYVIAVEYLDLKVHRSKITPSSAFVESILNAASNAFLECP